MRPVLDDVHDLINGGPISGGAGFLTQVSYHGWIVLKNALSLQKRVEVCVKLLHSDLQESMGFVSEWLLRRKFQSPSSSDPLRELEHL